MTGAWKLIYTWRSRAGRSTDEPEPDPPDSGRRCPRNRHGNGHGHVSRFHHRDESHHRPRSHSVHLQHHRSFCHRVSPPEQDSFQLDHRSSDDFETSNRVNGEVALRLTSRLSLINNTRLPESVLQARERLVERLRGVSLSGTRETTNYDFVDRIDETRRDWSNFNQDYTHITDDVSKKNPSTGVNWDSLCTLHLGVYKKSDETVDCCICLESFWDGDGLIRLMCGHRFHPSCLEPWVRNCRDCPYCRASITC